MAEDPRKAETMGEAAMNPDGSYNGLRALSWLSEALNPSKGLGEQEVKAVYDRVKAEKELKK